MMKFGFHAVLYFTLIASVTLGDTTYCVRTNGNDLNSGVGWANAKQSIEAAVSVAENSDTILVSNGVYEITSSWVEITNALTIRSENGPEFTTLKAAYTIPKAERSILMISNSSAFVSGFTLRDGSHGSRDVGSAVNLYAGTVSNCLITACNGTFIGAVRMWGGLLTHCQIFDNSTTASGPDRTGAGAYLTDGTIRFCNFINNVAARGGGAYIAGASAVVENCAFYANSNNALFDGGGVYMTAGLVNQCILATNSTSTYGGAIFMEGGIVSNSLVFANTAIKGGGGIRIAQATARLEHVTIANNLCTETTVGHGLYMTAGIASNIIVHANGIFPYRYGEDNVYKTGGTLTYSCASPLQGGTGNIAAEPLFVSPENGDYRLLPGSPCRDAGSASAVTVDLDGNPRPMDGDGDTTALNDMGCYEATNALAGPLACGFSVVPDEGKDSVEAVLTAYAVGTDTDLTSYSWDFGDGSAVESGPALGSVSHTFGPGFHTVKLTVNSATESASSERYNAVRVTSAITYVSTTGSDTPPYDTTAKATTNIQAAFDAVWANDEEPGTVRVAPGTYTVGTVGQLVLLRPVNLVSDNGPETTVVDAGFIKGRRGIIVNHTQAFVSGFTVQRGYTGLGDAQPAGLRLDSGTVSNCIITDCRGHYAGGVRVSGGMLTDCIITNNISDDSGASGRGGGLFQTGGVVQRCLIVDNISNLGGGVYLTGGTLRECRVLANTAGYWGTSANDHGGGIHQSGGTILNTLVAGNTAKYGYGGGIYITGAGSLIINATVCDNTAFNTESCGGIHQVNGAIRNTISHFNGTNLVTTGGTITYSSVGIDPIPDGTGNINDEPLLSQQAPYYYSLLEGSPGVDEGTSTDWTKDDADLAGMARIVPIACDMGAYEFQDFHGTIFLLQ